MAHILDCALYLASMVTGVTDFMLFTAAPAFGMIGYAVAYFLLVTFVLWWVSITAGNVSIAFTAWREPTTYYALKQG